MDRELLRQAIKEKLGEDSELMELGSGGSGCGIEGSNPQRYYASAEISGHSKYFAFRDEDSAHHYLPNFGFQFGIGCSITSPYSWQDKSGIVSFKARGMSSVVPENKVTLWVELDENMDFFDILDAIRSGERFAPFKVRGDKQILSKIESHYFLRVDAYVAKDEVHSYITDIANVDVEGAINHVMDIFSSEISGFKALKPLFQATDKEGTRLWADRGLQSPTYYALCQKLGRKLLDRVMRTLKHYRMEPSRTWGVAAKVRLFRWACTYYGPMALLLPLVFMKESFGNLFKSAEQLRAERLREYKEELKQRKQ